MRSALSAALLVLLEVGCGRDRPPARAPSRDVTITIAGTNDLHGAVDRLPILAGYVANLRAARAADGGGLVLVDAGDMFQGTLESNLNEGAAVIDAYNAIGYTAAAVGNHEFDFGPVGPAATARGPGDDPRGALKARARQARFPILAANLADAATGARVDWPELPASVTVEVAGVRVGIVGVTTEVTPETTIPANFVGLRLIPPAAAIVAEARKLRDAGAQIVVVAAHAGSRCTDFSNPDDLASCDRDDEIFRIARALPVGLVDVIVAGHVHLAMAHRVNGIAIIESHSSGRALGRVDMRIASGRGVVSTKIYPPRDLCPLGDDGKPAPASACKPADYEGKPVVADARVQAIVDGARAEAERLREEKLGVTLGAPFARSYGAESAEGNLVTDLMLAARPDADLAATNGGGLRAELPAGPLTYGALFRAIPFDNRLAIVKLSGGQLRRLVAENLAATSSVLAWSGMTVTASCTGADLTVVLRDRKGQLIDDDRRLSVVSSDFLATGGEGGFAHLGLPEGAIAITDLVIRDVLADVLRASPKKELWPADFFDAKRPRLALPRQRPVTCTATK